MSNISRRLYSLPQNYPSTEWEPVDRLIQQEENEGLKAVLSNLSEFEMTALATKAGVSEFKSIADAARATGLNRKRFDSAFGRAREKSFEKLEELGLL
jgi:DNA-directed RNA polymerase specialized sigma24 family protein